MIALKSSLIMALLFSLNACDISDKKIEIKKDHKENTQLDTSAEGKIKKNTSEALPPKDESKKNLPEIPLNTIQNDDNNKDKDIVRLLEPPKKPLNDANDRLITQRAQALLSGVRFPYNLKDSVTPQQTLWRPTANDLTTAEHLFKAQLKPAGIDNIFHIANLSTINQKTAYFFYESKNPGAAFANTYPSAHPFACGTKPDQVQVTEAELCFQAEKFHHFNNESLTAAYQKVAQLRSQYGAKTFVQEIGKLTSQFADKKWYKKWDDMSLSIMAKIHAARFKAEPALFLGLISTSGDTLIIENAGPHDGIWGNGPKMRRNSAITDQRNQLGELYMLHRQRFWYDFKKAVNARFNPSNLDHLIFMLKWLDNYDGGAVR